MGQQGVASYLPRSSGRMVITGVGWMEWLRAVAGGWMGKAGHGWEIYNGSLADQLLSYQAA